MTKAYQEAKLKDGSAIYRADAAFDDALESLSSEQIEQPIFSHKLAEARMQFPRRHSLNGYGSYTAEGFAYAKNAEPIISRPSVLITNRDLAKLAVEANRQRKYFTTENKELYDEQRAIAEQDSDKSQLEQRAIILPSRESFAVSPIENPETAEFLFGKDFAKYLQHCDRSQIIVYPVSSQTVDSQSGTLLTQLWLLRLGYDSGVVGGSGDLDYGGGVRGVRAPAGAVSDDEVGASQKISEELYSSKQIAKALKTLKFSGLEAQLINQLRNK